MTVLADNTDNNYGFIPVAPRMPNRTRRTISLGTTAVFVCDVYCMYICVLLAAEG